MNGRSMYPQANDEAEPSTTKGSHACQKILIDADIMWLRNPFSRFYTDTNLQISCDSFGGNPTDLQNAPNGGFNHIKFNPFNRALGLQIKFPDTVYFGAVFQPKQGLEPRVHDACELLCWLGQ
ncbi:nucleotide-diphospho-sugar transferase family protein [Striga asiatica]|uniref:Nucleotide-diphospho-sugar transferase family protein n=1 Tax=Striga asiatica TaxID=4170 RepID=A0A5A7Q709_STRAF|nr:nucleotide-diphospho-sugar transferase family protein [Striga asiatica]